MDINNLTEAEKVSAAKAESAGVQISTGETDDEGNPVVVEPLPEAAAPKVKPEGIPDKFWNKTTGEVDVAGLAKSYTELEKTRGQKPTAAVVPPAVDPAAVTPEAKAAAEAATALAAAKAAEAATTPEGIAAAKVVADKAAADALAAAAAVTPEKTIQSANEEFAKDGKLSDATYDTLAKTGISKSMVDMYIAGQVATRDAAVRQVTDGIGGKEVYDQVSTWAKAALTPAELAEYNQNVQGSVSVAKLAVAALHARYVAENGTDGVLAAGGNGNPGSGGGYANQSEMTAAIRDPRYKSDDTYRASVVAKIAKSKDF